MLTRVWYNRTLKLTNGDSTHTCPDNLLYVLGLPLTESGVIPSTELVVTVKRTLVNDAKHLDRRSMVALLSLLEWLYLSAPNGSSSVVTWTASNTIQTQVRTRKLG